MGGLDQPERSCPVRNPSATAGPISAIKLPPPTWRTRKVIVDLLPSPVAGSTGNNWSSRLSPAEWCTTPAPSSARGVS